MTDMHLNILSKFPYLTDEKLDEILSMGEPRMLAADEIFIAEGERSTRMGFIVQGMMRNYITNDKGDEVTVLLATEMTGIAPYKSFLLDMPATETSAAVEQTLLLVFDFHAFRQKALSDAILTRVYIQMMEDVLIAAIERIEDFTQRKPEERYQRILETQPFLIDRAPLKYLASYLGITAVSLSRIRKRLSQNRN